MYFNIYVLIWHGKNVQRRDVVRVHREYRTSVLPMEEDFAVLNRIAARAQIAELINVLLMEEENDASNLVVVRALWEKPTNALLMEEACDALNLDA
jgi:hypothetical protein